MRFLNLMNALRWRGNPITKLGKFYFILIIMKIIVVSISFPVYLHIARDLELAVQTGNLAYVGIALNFLGYLLVLGTTVFLVSLIIESYLYIKAWGYSKMKEIGLVGISYGSAIMFLVIGYLILIGSYFNEAQCLLEQIPPPQSLIANEIVALFLIGIGSIPLFLGVIILVIVLSRISFTYDIEEAQMALFMVIIQMILNFAGGMIRITSPLAAYARGIFEVILGIVSVVTNLYLYRTFIKLGSIYDEVKKNPELLNRSLEEISESVSPIKLKDFARNKRIPYEWLISRLKEEMDNGRISGHIINDIFYPAQQRDSNEKQK